MIVFNFVCEGPSLRAIVDFLVLDVFNGSNLLSEAVIGLKLFYPKSFRKQFCAFLKAANFIKAYFVSAKLMLMIVFNLDGL